MKLRPLSDVIVVKQHTEDEKTASGIIIAVSGPEKKMQGEIIACGKGEILPDGTRRNMEAAVGDVIVFGEYAGQKWKYNGEDYLVMREKDIVCVLDK